MLVGKDVELLAAPLRQLEKVLDLVEERSSPRAPVDVEQAQTVYCLYDLEEEEEVVDQAQLLVHLVEGLLVSFFFRLGLGFIGFLLRFGWGLFRFGFLATFLVLKVFCIFFVFFDIFEILLKFIRKEVGLFK